MAKRRSETQDEIRRLNNIVKDLVREATRTELPAPDSRMRAFIGDHRLRVVGEEEATEGQPSSK